MIRELFALSRITAGFVAVMVGYTSSAVIVFQAAAAAGGSDAVISSWLWALGVGMALSTVGLSVYYKTPILVAWSTPGAALMVTSLSGATMSEAVGAFLLSSLLITVSGVAGWFERIVRFIPHALASAMLAGVLLQFGLDIFGALERQLFLVSIMLLTYLLLYQRFPRYVIPLVLVVGLLVAAGEGEIDWRAVSWEFTTPIATLPSFDLATLIGVGIPLFIVTMASQNIPGMAVLRAHGYQVPASPLIGWTGLTGLVFAIFGGYAYNLAAITAAICMGKEADPDPAKRYLVTIWAGLFYLLVGLFGATVAGFFAAFPEEFVLAIAGLALLGTIGNSLATSLRDSEGREAALLTFLITASGASILGVGSAFWGLLIGLFAYHLIGIREALFNREKTD